MSRRTRLLVLLVSTPLVVVVAVGGLLGSVMASPQRAPRDLQVFSEVVRLITGAYVEPPNIDKVMDGAMRGLADGLDHSSSYLTPAEVKAFESRAAAPKGEVGVTVVRQGYLRIVGVRDGSPAARAGIRSGDYIRAIGDLATRDMSSYSGSRLLVGEPGSKVKLLVFRGNPADPHQIELTREVTPTERATGRKLPTGESYVRVTSFAGGAAQAIRAAAQTAGVTANRPLILDLRDVGDGTPEDGIAAARLFVAKGTLATLATRQADPVITPAGSGDGAIAAPIVAIVTRGTGSAAEVLAAALAGNKRGVLVGETTAGVAGVQTLVRLPEGHGMLMTTARYLRADGKSIHQGRDAAGGLRPDVFVELPAVAFDQPQADGDALLAKAVEEAKKVK